MRKEEREHEKKRSRFELDFFFGLRFDLERKKKSPNSNAPAGGSGLPPKTPVMRRMKVDLPQPVQCVNWGGFEGGTR